MPVHQGQDENGTFYQWGDGGKKYHYVEGDESSRQEAEQSAGRQGRAAHARGYREAKT